MSKYIDAFDSNTDLGKEALGAITLVGVKKEDGSGIRQEYKDQDEFIQKIVGQPYLNARIIEDSEKVVVTISSDNDEEGTVSPVGEIRSLPDSIIEITATPSEEYEFLKWVANGEESTENPLSFTVPNADATVVAYFQAK